MENLRRVLLWEVIRYSAAGLFTLLSVCKTLNTNLSADPSYMYWFMEEMYGDFQARGLSF